MDDSEIRIVLLGKTGAGKSSLANTIFGEEVFKIDDSPNAGTSQCAKETRSVNGRSITWIDTPGFFDPHKSEEELRDEIVKCIIECAPGPHVFLILLKVEKFTPHEKQVIDEIRKSFSEEAFKYTAVVFTHGDQLTEGKKIEEFVKDSKGLRDLVQKCGGRCHVVDNKHWKDNQQDEYRRNPFQVAELLKTIDKIVMENNGSYYTNKMLQTVKKEIQQEEKRIKLLPVTISEQEITKQAKVNVLKKFSIRLAGTATGVLLGALLGVPGMIIVVIKALMTMQPTAAVAAEAACLLF
ncbi:GTPase IMAP family member 7-like [Thunnus maccoyii]|uniref:GTPase IMAP family member 7-like n=1 Tax=Thunnus maccoyii TaxID=8240 RepID=UPI001C4BB2D1|nr:GTPase IMAP family member 7-like [Thunnus maccoyii]